MCCATWKPIHGGVGWSREHRTSRGQSVERGGALLAMARLPLAAWRWDESWQAAVDLALNLEQLGGLRQSVARGTPQGDLGWVQALATRAGVETDVASVRQTAPARARHICGTEGGRTLSLKWR